MSTISLELTTIAEHAAAASELLNEAWDPPAAHYTPDFLIWQSTFPAPWPLPAVAAIEGNTLVGFAGTSARRMRYQSTIFHSLVVSFVAVRRDRRNLRIAAALYDKLLEAVKQLAVPVITFAIPDSPGERALQTAYLRAGIKLRPFGTYPGYMAAASKFPASPDWEASAHTETDSVALAAKLDKITERCSTCSHFVWNAPDTAELKHYDRDSQIRQLILLKRPGAEWSGAAFVVQTAVNTQQGVQTVPGIEAILLRPEDASALPYLFSEAFRCSPSRSGAVLSLPNLVAFDNSGFRQAGVRKMSVGFHGYLYASNLPLAGAIGTSQQIV